MRLKCRHGIQNDLHRSRVAGALPFVACAVLSFLGITSIAPFGELDVLAGSYGVAILSFIAGTHWAFQLLRGNDTPHNLLITSNVVFLAVWISWIGAPLAWALWTQIAAFAYLLFVDGRLSSSGVTTDAYYRMRKIATFAAFVSLLVLVSLS